MTMPTKILAIAVPTVAAVGLVTAIVVGGGRLKHEATIPSGTVLVGVLEHEVSTERSRSGDAVELHTVAPIRLASGAEIAEGVVIRGVVTEAKGGGRIAGAPELALRFTEIEVDGDDQPITAQPFRVTGRNDAGKSAVQIGGGAVAGGIVGRVVGGKGGTLPGAVVGAAIGTGVAVSSEGGKLILPAGQRLKIRLSSPVTVRYRT